MNTGCTRDGEYSKLLDVRVGMSGVLIPKSESRGRAAPGLWLFASSVYGLPLWAGACVASQTHSV